LDILPGRGPGAIVFLAETCQPAFSTPRFLSAKRSAVSSRREEVAFFRLRLTRMRQKGRGPFEILGVPDLQCLGNSGTSAFPVSTLSLACFCEPVWLAYNDFPAEQQAFGLWPSQGTFALQKSL